MYDHPINILDIYRERELAKSLPHPGIIWDFDKIADQPKQPHVTRICSRCNLEKTCERFYNDFEATRKFGKKMMMCPACYYKHRKERIQNADKASSAKTVEIYATI